MLARRPTVGRLGTRALVNHLVSGNLWAAGLAAPAKSRTPAAGSMATCPAQAPAAAYAGLAAAAAAFRRPGAVDAPCAVCYGPVPGSVS